MHAQAVAFSVQLQWPERTTPADHAGKTSRMRHCRHGPVVENNRLRSRDPAEITRWNRAVDLTDVFANAYEHIMAAKQIVQAKLMPHLSESRIDVEEDAATGRGQNFIARPETHDVEKKLG